jgi:D-beta-D-heptose 7-phosphate kinase/D-beta-D-heptose 1-phosphate adenosyltransferase
MRHGESGVDQRFLNDYVAAQRVRGRAIVLTNGCFDVLHLGHVGYLQQARALGDLLVVGVNSDDSVRALKGPDRPINPEADRAALLAALSCVDEVVVFGELTPRLLIESVRPDVYVKGGDYAHRPLPEHDLVVGLGGRVEILGHFAQRSTTALISRIRAGGSRTERSDEPPNRSVAAG